jgi:uncharacterized Zn finger protein
VRPWYEHGSSEPIAVDGGIKARSKRGSIGEQWWSKRFIAVLESYGMSGRLQRGRSYARHGQVLELSLSTGKVAARVQGSRPAPYKVMITVLPLTTAQWREVESRLAGQALFRARMLAGEMPPEIEQVFAGCGTPLFPRSSRDLEMSCSCPDWEVPCKHLAAVCYVLAEAFDDDPFAVLAWRGKGRDDLLSALRGTTAAGSGAAASGAGDRADTVSTSPAQALLSDVTGVPLTESLADFWSPGLSQARLRALPVSPVTPPDLLLRLSNPPAVEVRGKPLRDVMAPAYAQLAKGASADSGDLLPSRREDHDRERPGGALLESPPGGVIPGCLCPQAVALVIARLPRMDLDLRRPHLDLGVGEGAQVVDPSGAALAPTEASDDDEARAVRHVGESRDPALPAPGSDMSQQQHRRMARDVMADPAPRRLVQGRVRLPQEVQHRRVSAGWIRALDHVSLTGEFHRGS